MKIELLHLQQLVLVINEPELVIKELDNWLQVQDQTTGAVGFIKKTLVIE